jgi:hypothetical protein
MTFAAARAQGDWEFYTVASGTKPSLDLDSGGNPHIAYILETTTGWVRYASWNSGTMGFDTATVNNGNFYGPPSMKMDRNDIPGVNYHRHTPVPEQMYATMVGTSWTNTPIASDNHDGWDNSLEYDSNNLPRTSSIDPVTLGGTASTGVEYAVFNGTTWTVESIGSTLIEYFTSTSLELDANDNPHITYYDSNTDDLMYATKNAGVWTITPVDTDGDVGRFSSLRLDGNGNPHISYYRHLGDSVGIVKYAAWNGSAWEISDVDTLHRVFLSGARNITSLHFDTYDNPDPGDAVISYGDEKTLNFARRTNGQWVKERIVDVNNESTLLGQVNSLAVSALGDIHIAYYVLLTRTPLTGTIKYVRKPMTSDIPCGDFTSLLARCVGSGTVQARATLLNSTIHAGKMVHFEIDQTLYPATIVTNGVHSRAQIAVGGFSSGQHTVTLFDPAGCLNPLVVSCANGTKSAGDEWEKDDALWSAVTPSGRSSEGAILLGNYPNPFNPSTTIGFSLGTDALVSLKVYNVLGQEVATLVDGLRAAGEHTITWDGRNGAGIPLSSGVYMYILRSGNIVETRTMLLTK